MFAAWGNVPLRVTRLLAFDGEAVYDPSGVDYLYTRYTVSLEALTGRFADGYFVGLNTEEGPVPWVQSGLFAATQSGTRSAAAIRHALAQRAPFAIWTRNAAAGGFDVLLASDAPDAENGPHPVEPASVISTHGEGQLTFVRFTFTVAIRECPITTLGFGPNGVREIRPGAPAARNPVTQRRLKEAGKGDSLPPKNEPKEVLLGDLGHPKGSLQLLRLSGRAPVCLSNRWTQSTSYDPANESPVYRFVGQAIFNRQALDAIAVASPEQFSGSLLPLLVPNCVREINDVTLSADGLTLSYDVTDRQVVRGYLDYRVARSGKQFRVVDPNGPPRYVAGVSLVSKREYSQPSLSAGAFEFFGNLSQINFANEAPRLRESPLPGKDDALEVEERAATELRNALNRTLAIAQTANSLLPTVSEGAVAEVRITREGKLADAQSLAFALCSGALGVGNDDRRDRRPQRNGTLARYAAVPPQQNVSVECDHVNGVVRVAMTTTYSGLVDFVLGGQQSAMASLLMPIPDDVVGGRAPLGIFNILDAVGALPSVVALALGGGRPEDFILKLADKTVINKYADELLVTHEDAVLRGPTGDGVSRGLSALLIRSAALLLKPCEQPAGPANQYLFLPQPEVAVESQRTESQPPPLPLPTAGSVVTPGGGIAPGAAQPGTLSGRR